MRNRIMWAVATAAAALVVAACGEQSSSEKGGEVKPPSNAPKALAKLGAGEGQADIVAWAGYAEDGSTDPKVDWATPFEQKTVPVVVMIVYLAIARRFGAFDQL
jgi:putative spermidine/putrescine transport system substrate-binding protein